ncbi:hypothetical protein L3X38_019644 [Prunus dulcis]|uniref:Uncharacterized protein n=1 Tax=Prunus dulcis TaxID=3755 RepID=A0AAD4WBA1_PRUDU|nr:hypothetical protein L3X38_019644 [Prunus dulcis]
MRNSIVEEGLPTSMYMNPRFKRGSPAALVNVKELPVSSRSRNVRVGNMNPSPSIRTLDMKVDNLGRELREDLKGVESKVLFCSTEIGRTSFVRQLEPDWHIDANPDIIFQLSRFIKYQLHISPTRTERAASNVFNSPSLEQFFGCV